MKRIDYNERSWFWTILLAVAMVVILTAVNAYLPVVAAWAIKIVGGG